MCLLILSVTLFECHFVSPCEVSEGSVCVSACVSSYFVDLSASVSLIIHLY